VPESYGKRQRDRVKARKAAAKEERRLARHERMQDRAAAEAAGLPPPESWLAKPDPDTEASAPTEESDPDAPERPNDDTSG
jgi:hypothetical protein